jgi:predicted Rossmann fold flavoprotein
MYVFKMTNQSTSTVVIGGGAAGLFSAIASKKSSTSTILLEKTNTLLAKVRISGGGRCNVTHACFDPKQLAANYPRGNKALIGLFHRFQPRDTIQWFESRGVPLKVEDDGRMFPVTDSSQTIIDCLLREAMEVGVDIQLRKHIERIEKIDSGFRIILDDDKTLDCNRIILATGSNKDGLELARSFGHAIVPPVPSLFTFNIPNFVLEDLSGNSVENVLLKIEGSKLEQTGPLLITHWGFSGPAALKLSAWGARHLHELNYQTKLIVNWLPAYSRQQLIDLLLEMKQKNPSHTLLRDHIFPFSRQLQKRLLEMAGIDPQKRLADIANKHLVQLAERLQADTYIVSGKTTYKQEFVTCGGVSLDEVNFKTMESKLCPGLYFAGEILDIDGITGGFNFQNAWTTGWIAGKSCGE